MWGETMQLLMVGFIVCVTLGQAGLEPGPEPSAEPVTVRMTAVEGGFRIDLPTDYEHEEFVFEKEPVYSGTAVTRGSFKVGPQKNDRIGYAVDTSAGKLYVDLNRNLDLTDDSAGVFESDKDMFGIGFSKFKGVRITLGDPPDARTYVADVDIMARSVSVTVCSGWSGDVELHGVKWRFCLADNLDGAIDDNDFLLVMRATEAPPDPGEWNVSADDFPARSAVFFGGFDHRLAYSFKDGVPEIAITEVETKTVPVEFPGQFVKFLVLNGPVHARFDAPGKQILLPPGVYTVGSLYLDAGKTDKPEIAVPGRSGSGGRLWRLGVGASTLGLPLVSQPPGTAPQERFTVSENTPAAIKIGGPLNNTVSITRFSNILKLTHTVKGIGGEPYDLPNSILGLPSFVIYRGDKAIARGKFNREFG